MTTMHHALHRGAARTSETGYPIPVRDSGEGVEPWR